jgi:hypothetical protein
MANSEGGVAKHHRWHFVGVHFYSCGRSAKMWRMNQVSAAVKC